MINDSVAYSSLNESSASIFASMISANNKPSLKQLKVEKELLHSKYLGDNQGSNLEVKVGGKVEVVWKFRNEGS